MSVLMLSRLKYQREVSGVGRVVVDVPEAETTFFQRRISMRLATVTLRSRHTGHTSLIKDGHESVAMSWRV